MATILFNLVILCKLSYDKLSNVKKQIAKTSIYSTIYLKETGKQSQNVLSGLDVVQQI